MGLWSRLFPKEQPARARIRDLELRLDDLEAALEHLSLQHKKLRGRVTGGLRQDPQEEAPEAPEPMISPEASQRAQEIENGRILAAVRGQRGLLRG